MAFMTKRTKTLIKSFMIVSVLMLYLQWKELFSYVNNTMVYRDTKLKPPTLEIPLEKIRNILETFFTKQVLDDMIKAYNKTDSTENRCSLIPSGLVGPIKLELNQTKINSSKLLITRNIEAGGYWKPANCKPYYKTAIVVPYRNRALHQKIFLHNIHQFLQKQMLEYQIYFVEQTFTSKLNRGMLRNIGFEIASKTDDYDCYVMHDVDLLPEDDRNMYICSSKPRHMAVAIAKYGYSLMYGSNFGGVCSLTKKEMTLINGYSNAFFNWGGEDDDLFNRVNHNKMGITRYSQNISRYTNLDHNQEEKNSQRVNILVNPHKRPNDGLTSLNYTLIKKELLPLYTRILVDIKIEDIQKQFPDVPL